MPRGLFNPRTRFALTLLGVLMLALLPVKWLGWLKGLRNPVDVIVRPVSGPMASLSTWLRPAQRPGGGDGAGGLSDEASEIERQRDEFKWLYLREVDRNAELEALVRDLQGGSAWSRPPGVRRLEAPRVGSDPAAGTVDYRRGSLDGVGLGSVAVARRSEQIVGVATDVRANVTSFRLLTDKRLQPPFAEGVVMPEGAVTVAQLQTLPRCQLRPVGDGTLVDENVGVTSADAIAPGMIVRLNDPSWPDAARMLVLGRVVRVEPSENPLYRRVVVRPELDVARTHSVIIQFPAGGGGAGDGAAPIDGGRGEIGGPR
ncbi:MAG: hypothetical protein ACKVZJ_00115 [Phycisphaerales bacterium]